MNLRGRESNRMELTPVPNGINLVRNSRDLRELATLAKVEDLGVE
jgi:hypothetical protein